MASPVAQFYDEIVSRAIAPAQQSLGINHIELADYNAVGPELGDRISRMGRQHGLNAVVLVPTTPEEDDHLDAARRGRKVTQPFDLFFVWRRNGTTMRDVIDKWANPLHDSLCASQMRRLGGLRLMDALRRPVGHVTGVDVSYPDLDPPDNSALYPHMSCFSIALRVSYIALRDFDAAGPTTPTSQRFRISAWNLDDDLNGGNAASSYETEIDGG